MLTPKRSVHPFPHDLNLSDDEAAMSKQSYEKIEICNAFSLVGAAHNAGNAFGQTPWFRGQSDPSWDLRPAVHRSYNNFSEAAMVARFMHKAPSRHPKCPDAADYAGWLCLMQHYGLPTRLLDWTESILVAAYFAIANSPANTDADIWALSPGGLNLNSANDFNSTFTFAHPDAQNILMGAFHPRQLTSGALAIASPDIDLRMLMQHSFFTIHGDKTALEEMPNSRNYLIRFKIPQTARSLLSHDLHVLGIRESNIFPDLAHLAQDLARECRSIGSVAKHSDLALSVAKWRQEGEAHQ